MNDAKKQLKHSETVKEISSNGKREPTRRLSSIFKLFGEKEKELKETKKNEPKRESVKVEGDATKQSSNEGYDSVRTASGDSVASFSKLETSQTKDTAVTRAEVEDAQKNVRDYYEKCLNKDMVAVMMGAKRVELQLISKTQKEQILGSCKDLAATYKSVKSALKGTVPDSNTPQEVAPEAMISLLNQFDSDASNLVTTIQNTSISVASFQAFIPTVQALRKDIHSIKGFETSNGEQQVSHCKLIMKTIQLEEKRPQKSLSSENVTQIQMSASTEKAVPSSPSKSVSASALENSPTKKDTSKEIYRESSADSLPKVSSPTKPPRERPKTSFFTISPLTSRKRSERNLKSDAHSSLVDYNTQTEDLELRRTNSSQGIASQATLRRPTKYKSLFEAAQANDVEDARELRKKGLGINGVDSTGSSALHHGAMKGHMEITKYFIAEGINIHLQDNQGMTALDRACLNGHENVALYLAERGAKFDMFSKNGIMVMDKSNLPKSFWERLLGASESKATNKSIPVIQLDEEPTSIKTPAPPQLARISSKIDISNSSSTSLIPPRPISPSPRRIELQEAERQELIPHVELFSECAAKCTLNLSTQTQSVDLFNEPLKGMTVSLMGLLSVSDKTQDLFKDVHTSVVSFVQSVKQYFANTGDRVLRRSLMESCLHVIAKFIQALLSIDPPLDQDEVLGLVQKYLLSVKEVLAVSSSDLLELAEPIKTIMKNMVKMFDGALRYDTQDTDAFKNIIAYCIAISENTQRIIQVKQQGQDATEVTKNAMNHVRTLANAIKESRAASNAFSFKSKVESDLDTSAKQVELLLKSDTSLQPQVFKQILPHLGFHSRELAKISKANTASVAIESILTISRATSTIIEYIDSFCRQVHWRFEGSKHLLKLLVKMLHLNNTQVKLVGSMEVVKMLSVNQNFLTLSGVSMELRTLALLDTVLVQSLALVKDDFNHGESASFVIKSPLKQIEPEPEKISEPVPEKKSPKISEEQLFNSNVQVVRPSIMTPPKPSLRPPPSNPVSRSPSFEEKEEEQKTIELIQKLTEQANAAGLELKAAAGVKLFQFLTEDPKWRETRIVGELAFLHDVETGNLFFQITDPDTFDPLFVFKIPDNFVYEQKAAYFHRFKTETGFVAFSFFNIDAGRQFYQIVIETLASRLTVPDHPPPPPPVGN